MWGFATVVTTEVRKQNSAWHDGAHLQSQHLGVGEAIGCSNLNPALSQQDIYKLGGNVYKIGNK